jgi:transcriptional regulator with XRE-family HTH domain
LQKLATRGYVSPMPSEVHPLRVVREQRGLTVRALALRVDIAPSTISRIENRQRVGSLPMLARLADALDVDAELLGGLSDERVA